MTDISSVAFAPSNL